MRKKGIALVILVLAVTGPGCIKKTYNQFEVQAAVKNFAAYGPLELWGARCGHEALDLVYAPGEEDEEFLTLDVYWNDHEGLQPIIIQIHGGAWEMGDKDALNSQFRSRWLANHGYVVFNVNYRLLPKHPIQTQVNDVMGATIWAKEHAGEYGGDPERAGVVGGSAGGHLAAMVAWASDDPFFQPTGHASSSYDSDVKAAVPWYGVFDLEKTLSAVPGQPANPRLSNLGYGFFTKLDPGPARDELFQHISPKYHVDASIPPTFFICGDADNFGLYPDSAAFRLRLEQAGVPTGLYTAHGARHGFDLHYGEPYTTEAVKAMLEWLDQYLK